MEPTHADATWKKLQIKTSKSNFGISLEHAMKIISKDSRKADCKRIKMTHARHTDQIISDTYIVVLHLNITLITITNHEIVTVSILLSILTFVYQL